MLDNQSEGKNMRGLVSILVALAVGILVVEVVFKPLDTMGKTDQHRAAFVTKLDKLGFDTTKAKITEPQIVVHPNWEADFTGYGPDGRCTVVMLMMSGNGDEYIRVKDAETLGHNPTEATVREYMLRRQAC